MDWNHSKRCLAEEIHIQKNKDHPNAYICMNKIVLSSSDGTLQDQVIYKYINKCRIQYITLS